MTGGINLPDMQIHPPCSLLSLPTYTSYKSQQEEGISCRLIPARRRSCSLKANLIALISPTEELLTALSEKVKFCFYKSRTHRDQLQGTNLTPQTTVGVERKHGLSVCPELCSSNASGVPGAGSFSRPVGKVLPEVPSPISSD